MLELSGWDDLRPEVKAFALAMETQLRENHHKGGWQEMADHEVLARLQEETCELWHALKYGANQQIGTDEAADVANFAMMAADAARRDNLHLRIYGFNRSGARDE